jgi:uncharacterized protein (TIGR03435 family)
MKVEDFRYGSPITGAPAWVDSDGFDTAAKPKATSARSFRVLRRQTADGMLLMLRALFEDRFQLKVH